MSPADDTLYHNIPKGDKGWVDWKNDLIAEFLEDLNILRDHIERVDSNMGEFAWVNEPVVHWSYIHAIIKKWEGRAKK